MKLFGKHCRNRWIAGLLLLAYGSAGVLGYGLHAVWDCGHDHGLAYAHSHEHHHHHAHGHGCHHHEAALAGSESDFHDSLAVAADDCPICEFLVQAQSPYVMEFATVSVGPVAAIATQGEISWVAPLLGTPPARGPPLG